MCEKQKYEAGNIDNFSYLVDLFYSKVYYHCLKIMKNHFDAADITQNTFIKAFVNINHLKNNNSFGAWIFTICNNEIKMFFRKRKISEIEHPGQVTEKSYSDLYSAIDMLDEKYRDILVLKYFSDFRLYEISSLIRLNEKTIKSRLYEARKKLKNLLSDKLVLKNLPHNKERRRLIMSIVKLLDLGAKVIPCMSVWGQKELLRCARENTKFSDEVLKEFSKIEKGNDFVLECNGSISYDEAIKILACCDEAVLYRLNGQDYKTWRNGRGNQFISDIAEYMSTGAYVDSIETILYVPSIIDTVNWYKKYLGWDGDNPEDPENYGHCIIHAYNNETAGYMYNTFKGFHLRPSNSGNIENVSCFIMVTSIENLRKKIISNGWDKVTEIKDNGWGTKGFNVEDLNGLILEVCEWIC